MLSHDTACISILRSCRKAVEFYTIELAQVADGTFLVSLTATTVDDEEPQLLCQQIASERVASIEDALAVIKEGVTGTLRGA